MSCLNNFLKTLTDFELAQFYKYRYHQFLSKSKDKIFAELIERDMDIENLDSYTENKNLEQQETRCPQCYSNKFYTASERETLEFVRSTIEVNEFYKTCFVCLFSEEKPKNYNQYRRISFFDYLKIKRKTRR